MIIPGIVISIVTFPGVAVHELAHQICCRICRIPVYEVKYFQAANPCGYVLHEPTANPWKNLLTGLGPFFFNTILGILITLPAYSNVFGYSSVDGSLGQIVKLCSYILYWLGVSSVSAPWLAWLFYFDACLSKHGRCENYSEQCIEK